MQIYIYLYAKIIYIISCVVLGFTFDDRLSPSISTANVCEGNAPEKKDIMAAQALLDISPTTSGEDKLFPPTGRKTKIKKIKVNQNMYSSPSNLLN